MKLKKITMVLSSLSLLSAMMIPVSAEDKTTNLTTEVKSDYTMTIPSGQNITFDAESTNIGEVSVTGNLKPNEKVIITVQKTEFERTGDASNKIKYSLKNNMMDFTGAEWTEAELRTATPKTYPLTVEISKQEWENAYAGNYTSTITFTAEIPVI